MMPTGKRRLGTALGALVAFIGLSTVAGLLATVAVTPAIAVSGLALDNGISAFNDLPDYLQIGPLDQTSTMFAKQAGTEVPIATFYAQNRVEVGWNDISQSVKDAAVSTEDPRFYDEGGIDVVGTLRGALSTYVLKGGTQGGSSISQQYVKNVLVQKCDSLDITLDDAKKQAVQTKKYEACYADATDDTPSRKLKEMRLAIGVSKKYSKNEILQGYLNITGFGGTIYGIQAAAEYYFDVSAKDLTLPQAATLVAILNNPNYLRIDGGSVTPDATAETNTAKNGFAGTLERRNYVLNQMLKEHAITSAEHDAAVKTPITPAITPLKTGCMVANTYNAGSFCDYVQRIIQTDPVFGATADERTALFNRGGLKIYTTLNLDLQQTAQSALNAYVPATLPSTDIGGANVSMEVGTGRIITMVQNKPFDNTAAFSAGTTSVNYNTDSADGGSQGFQTGSAYKVFSLIEWLKEGHSLNDIIDASHHTFLQSQFHESPPCNNLGGAPWNVANDDASANQIDVLDATAQSVNTAFAEMATQLDLCGIKQDAQSLLVHGADEQANPYIANPSSVLGTNYIAPLTMATAYAGLANNGIACSAIAIDSITGPRSKNIPVPKSICSTTPIDPSIAAAVIYDLKGVLTHGTGDIANPADSIPIFGKTGTTDDAYDNWFVSSTTKTAQATWVGNIQAVKRSNGSYTKTSIRRLTLGGQYGGDAKLHIAKSVITALNKTYGGGQFPSPDPEYLYSSQPAPIPPGLPTSTPSP
jgi:membrane peptidoglycan carboxypeptidase